ncbi:DinB family protein [Pseudonocardia nematodicida]|uniref:DinB family protein n=1 Tax=Pseudonocardia nematodicida TaxID=1206997 RepID=A0ABV1KFS9_9PSEU
MTGSFAVQDADELTQLTAFLDEYRTAIDATLDGLTEEQARRRLVPSATTLLGLLCHVAFVETVWFGQTVTGTSRAELGIPESVEESFRPSDDDTVASVRARYREVCARSRRAIAGLGPDDVVRGRGRPVTVRWLHLQVLKELAHHSGHADILREQILATG